MTPGSPMSPLESLDQQSKPFTARNGFFLLVSIQIGSGIFTSPSQVDLHTPSPAASLIVWLAGGLLAWTGATAFAELGAALPSSGGTQEYLRIAYGDIPAYLMALSWILVVKPIAFAILSILFIETLVSGFNGGVGDSSMGFWQTSGAILVLWIFIVLNCTSDKLVSRLMEGFTYLKFVTVSLVVLAGLGICLDHAFHGQVSVGATADENTDWYSRNWFKIRPGETEWAKISSWELVGQLCIALYGSLWAYSGWDNANFIASEMKDPGHSLPRAINAAMATVITCFLVANVSYYILLPWDVVSSSDAIAVVAARYTLGKTAGILFGLLVALSCAGALNGNIVVFGRLSLAATKRGYLPGVMYKEYTAISEPIRACFGALKRSLNHSKTLLGYSVVPNPIGDTFEEDDTNDVPEETFKENSPYWITLTWGGLIGSVYIILGNFRILVALIGIVEYTFFFFTVLGLIILRFRDSTVVHPYKPPLIIPLSFCLISGTVALRGIIIFPIHALVFFSVSAVGAVVFKIRARSQ